MMLAGTLLSYATNWATSYSTEFFTRILFWGINGHFQTMGFSPGSRLISNW